MKISDTLHQIFTFCLELFAFQTGQPAESHVDDVLSLFFGEAEAAAEGFAGDIFIGRRTDHRDYGVNLIDGFLQTFNDVQTRFRFFEVESRAAHNDAAFMLKIVAQGLRQVDDAGNHVTTLIRNQREHIGIEAVLHLRIVEKLVQHHLRRSVAL